MSIEASQKAFISHHIKLNFFNNSNLNAAVQNRISEKSEINFLNALENIQGDNKETEGVTLSELTLLAMAYFFERLFPEEVKIKTSYYSLNSIKGFLDACNNTPYTSIYEIDTTCYQLKEAALFKACYLVIQTAWFFNSDYFGRHQYLEYSSHYIKTGEQLPIEKYLYDKSDLRRKYNKIDENRNTDFHPKGEPAYKFVEQWYFYILCLVVNELELPTKHFKVNLKDFREYNPLTKCPRILRAETPFKVIECDIKSAFPSFLDLQTGANIKKEVYSNLMERKSITRSEAKIKFNSILNSGKYMSRKQIASFLMQCGYNEEQAETITYYTNGKSKFITYMADFEEAAILDFKETNNLKRSVRLHDSVLFIDTGNNHLELEAENGIIEFGMNVLKKPILTNRFSYSKKRLRFAYISSVPAASKEEYKTLIRKQILTTPKVKGSANGFKFYTEKYKYISASFNLTDYCKYDEFMNKCISMVSTLHYLNNEPISKTKLFLILSHIRQNSNIVFNVRYVFNELLRHLNSISDIEIQQRDFELTEQKTFGRDIEFLIAYNTAKGIVNQKYRVKSLYKMLEYKYDKEDFSFIDLKFRRKEGIDKVLKLIVLRLNELCTGYKRKPYAQKDSVQALYSILYKEPASYSFEHHKKANKTRLIQRKIQVYEKELLKRNRLINNRIIAKQYLFIAAELAQFDSPLHVQKQPSIIENEKAFLMQQITGKEHKSNALGAKAFNKIFVSKPQHKVKNQVPRMKDFNTSLEHSAFSISIEEASMRGEQFFQEYLKFNKINLKEEVLEMNKKEKYIFPNFDFDAE